MNRGAGIPQVENGYIKIANEIAEALFGLQLSGNQWRVVWVILRQTYGWNKKTDRISISFFEKKTGLKRRHIVRALNDLVERKIITKNDTTFITTYGFQKDYTKWELLPKMTHAKNGNGSLPKMTLKPLPKLVPTKDNKDTTQKTGEYLGTFEIFYEAYPKHQARKKALEAWKKIKPSDTFLETILTAIEKQKAYKTTLKSKGEFVPEWPLPATWLNQARWEDEIPEVKPSW